MSWETLAYTDAGIELLMDAVSGKQLTITQLSEEAVLQMPLCSTRRPTSPASGMRLSCWASSLLKKTAALPAA